MARTVKTPATPKTTAVTKAKAVKAAPKAVVDKVTKAAPAPKVNEHVANGVTTSTYPGLSGFLNANRRVKIMAIPARDTGTMTDRMQKSLYAMRKAYTGQHFNARGWDNGVLRDLAASGLISLSGGITDTIDGKTYMLDGEKPVQVFVTKAGAAYGTPAK
jgi:hypothetical protein